MGQTTLIKKGFRQGGPAGFGLRRLLVDDAGNPKIELRRLEHKSIQTDRVILVPGPPEEIEIVRRIYTDFVERGLTEQQIASRLNRQGILTDLERDWTRSTVRQVLTNEKYIGNNVWNKRSFKLKTKRVNNAPDLWVRAENAFEPIVDVGLFRAAQKIITTRSYRPNNDEMLEALQRVLKRHGYLSGLIIDEADTCPSTSAYQSRFGSLLRTYKLIGYQPDRDYRYVDINRRLREQHPEVIANVVSRLRETGARVENDGANSLLVMNEEIRASLVLSRCHINASGGARWFIRFDTSLGADITIAARMEPGEQDIRDFYLLPALECSGDKLRLFENNTNELDVYRFDTLDALYHLVRRTRIKDIL
ncbi:recombinase family protein [Brucella sp. BO3]|uniref:recombinase family protein n=1 Tax=Brucella sp. BO3 TaxID=2691913 RepID=UPI0035300CEE